MKKLMILTSLPIALGLFGCESSHSAEPQLESVNPVKRERARRTVVEQFDTRYTSLKKQVEREIGGEPTTSYTRRVYEALDYADLARRQVYSAKWSYPAFWDKRVAYFEQQLQRVRDRLRGDTQS